jgi:uracil-DNA glycosylase family 4
MTREEKTNKLQELKTAMEKDDSLPLKKGATLLVFGVGNPETEVLFIGEGPGYWEDQKGEPFVGQAGKLLNSVLQSIKLPREEVYITNVVHHRPPANRDPLPDEISAYGKYLDQIIGTINPKIIVTLGRFSMGKFLPDTKISLVHGRLYRVNWNEGKILIVPMYHPAAALRSGMMMEAFKKDFSKLPAFIKEANKIEVEQTKLI